jgi:hypothetical protein
MNAPQGPLWKPKNRPAGADGAFASAATPPLGPVLPPSRLVRHRPLGGTHGSNQTWVVSFTDIMGLMLTFFVLLYAMSERETQQSTSTDGAPRVQYDRTFQGRPGDMGDSEEISLPRVRYEKGLDLGYLTEILEERQSRVSGLALVTLKQDGGDVVMAVPAPLVMDRGDKADDVMSELVAIITSLPNQVDLTIVPGVGNGIAGGFDLARGVARRMAAQGYDRPLAIGVAAQPAPRDAMIHFRISKYTRS